MSEHCFFDYAPARIAGTSGDLTCETSVYRRAQDDWQSIVAALPAPANHVDDIDGMICDADRLAGLIDSTTDVVVRQSLRMVAEMRKFTAGAGAGAPFLPNKASLEILDKADEEWDAQLNLHPVYTKWLLQADLVACPRHTVIEALDRAPSDVIRHAVRELLSFREAFELAHGRIFR